MDSAEAILRIIVDKFERDVADGYKSSTRDYVLEMAKMVKKPVCPCCKLTDITLSLTCHNSDCEGYADEIQIYQGW